MADNYFKDWKSSLDKFTQCVEKDLAEIRRQKAEIQSLKLEVESMVRGRFISDSNRIILSAPEIIIGNVDRDGILRGDSPYSRVIIRSNDIDIEGSSPAGTTSGGSIIQRASRIETIAVDPGMDGQESVLGDTSVIIQQARSISLLSNDAKDVFTMPGSAPFAGISIYSDSSVNINATPSNAATTKYIDDVKATLSKNVSSLKIEMNSKKKELEKLIDDMEKCVKEQEGLTDNDFKCAISIGDINEANNKLESLQSALGPVVTEYTSLVFGLAEANRQIKAFDKAKKKLSSDKSDFKTKSTLAEVNIYGETINLTSVDGDGNLRTNAEASINMQAQEVNIKSTDSKGALMEKGKVKINAKKIDVSTADFKGKDSKNWENPAVGDISIVSKTVKVEAVDYETKDKKQEIKALTKGGKLSMRVESVDLLSADKEGKAVGSVSVNAKSVEIKSMDVDKEKLTDKELSAGSTMVLVSEKMWEGSKDSKVKSKQLQIASEKVAVIAKTTAEVQQDKATVQLDGGNLSVGGSKTQLYGDMTVNGKSEFKGDVKAPKAVIDNLEAKSSFKSTNISDGIAIPAAPSAAKLSAKLKEEDAPKKQQ